MEILFPIGWIPEPLDSQIFAEFFFSGGGVQSPLVEYPLVPSPPLCRPLCPEVFMCPLCFLGEGSLQPMFTLCRFNRKCRSSLWWLVARKTNAVGQRRCSGGVFAPQNHSSSLPPPRAPQLGAQRFWKGSSQDQRWGEGDRWTAWRLGAQAKEALERIKIISSPLKPRREDLTYMLLVGGERCTPRTQGLGRVVVVVARRGLSPDFLLQKHNNHPPQKKNTPR